MTAAEPFGWFAAQNDMELWIGYVEIWDSQRLINGKMAPLVCISGM
jgi:hypothetical protein